MKPTSFQGTQGRKVDRFYFNVVINAKNKEKRTRLFLSRISATIQTKTW